MECEACALNCPRSHSSKPDSSTTDGVFPACRRTSSVSLARARDPSGRPVSFLKPEFRPLNPAFFHLFGPKIEFVLGPFWVRFSLEKTLSPLFATGVWVRSLHLVSFCLCSPLSILCEPFSNLLPALSAGALHRSTIVGYHFASLMSSTRTPQACIASLNPGASAQGPLSRCRSGGFAPRWNNPCMKAAGDAPG